MTLYARIQAGTVAELLETDGDIAQMFAPELVWVACGPEVRPGWTYDGAAFAHPAPPASTEQARAWECIKGLRDFLSDTGGYRVAVGGVDKWFHSDPRSKTQQLGLVIAGAALPAGLQWKTMDGTFVGMTPTLAAQVYQAAMAQDAAIFQAAEVHRAAMLAAPDPDAYDYSAGWPQVFTGGS